MRHIIIAIAISVSTLLAPSVFAGNEESCESKGAHLPPAEYVAHMKSCLAEASSPANVRAVALQQKKAYCDKNVKNKGLKGDEKEKYLSVCMNHNEAEVQYAVINRGMAPAGTDTARKNYDKTLQEAPPAAGVK